MLVCAKHAEPSYFDKYNFVNLSSNYTNFRLNNESLIFDMEQIIASNAEFAKKTKIA